MKRTRLRKKSKSASALLKDDIQAWVRLITCKRDGGCILRGLRHCGGSAEVINDKIVANVVIQADHLITRSNSATFADTRLIVCLCKGCHMWKKHHEAEYNDLVKTILTPERIELWDKCMADYKAHKTHKMDWAMEILALKDEYKKLSTG